MQELISVIRKRQEDDEVQPFMWHEQIVELAESMLEKEKEVIMNAYIFGIQDEYVIGSQRYYNETFNTKEK